MQIQVGLELADLLQRRTPFRETKDTARVSLQEYLCTGSSKVTSYGFWAEKSPVIGPPGGRFNSTPGTYLNSRPRSFPGVQASFFQTSAAF